MIDMGLKKRNRGSLEIKIKIKLLSLGEDRIGA
jgi:hypothetical protein